MPDVKDKELEKMFADIEARFLGRRTTTPLVPQTRDLWENIPYTPAESKPIPVDLGGQLRSNEGILRQDFDAFGFTPEQEKSLLKSGEFLESFQTPTGERRIKIAGQALSPYQRANVAVQEWGKTPAGQAITTGVGIAAMAFVGVQAAQAGWDAFLRSSLYRNLNSWAKSGNVTIPKATQDATVNTMMANLSKKWLSQQAIKTIFNPTKTGLQVSPETVNKAESDILALVNREAPSLMPRATQTGAMAFGGKANIPPIIPQEPIKPPTYNKGQIIEWWDGRAGGKWVRGKVNSVNVETGLVNITSGGKKFNIHEGNMLRIKSEIAIPTEGKIIPEKGTPVTGEVTKQKITIEPIKGMETDSAFVNKTINGVERPLGAITYQDTPALNAFTITRIASSKATTGFGETLSRSDLTGLLDAITSETQGKGIKNLDILALPKHQKIYEAAGFKVIPTPKEYKGLFPPEESFITVRKEISTPKELLTPAEVTPVAEAPQPQIKPVVAEVGMKPPETPTPPEVPTPPTELPTAPPPIKPPLLSKIEAMWEGEENKVIGKLYPEGLRLKVEEKLLDKFAGINKITSKALKEWKKTHKEPFPIELNAELHAANLGGAADAGIQYAVDAFHNMGKALGKGISTDYVASYLHLKHNLDVLAMHPERKVSGGLKGAGEVAQALKELETTLGAEKYARVESAAAEITNLYAQYLEREVTSGLVSRDLADLLRSKYPNYNPIVYTFRLAEQAEGLGVGKAMSVSQNDIRTLSELGHDAARENPLNTMARMAIQKETLIRRNDAANAIARLVDKDELLKKYLGSIPPSQKGTLFYMQDGERHSVVVPRWLEKEAKLLGQLVYGDLEKFGEIANKVSRYGMTTANLAFFIPNMAVDSLTAMITYGVTPSRLVKRLAFNLKDIVSEDKTLSELRKAGGSMSGFWGKTPEEIAKEATRKGQLILKNNWDFKRIMGLPFETITKIGHAVEMTPRSAVMELELKRGRLLEEAALAARRSTIDFGRSGTAMRQANALFLYLNAGVQGSAVPFRALRDNPRSRWWLMGFLAAIVGTYAWNRQFKEYDDIPDYTKYGSVPIMLPSSEYDKRGNKVPHYILVIPNLREWALFSGTLVYAMRKLDKQSPDDFGQFLEAWLPPLNPVSQIVGTGGIPVPTQIGQTLAELFFNRDTFRNRDIVPEELGVLPPAEQFNDWTSITARQVGKLLGISPMKLDFFVKNVFGGLGTQLLTATDRILEKIVKGDDDVRIQSLLEQLQSIQDNSPPDKIPGRRADFLESLSPTDRELVLRLEVHPESRIPIISDIMNRLYRSFGGQIYDTAMRQAKLTLGDDTTLGTAREELNNSALQNALNFTNGSIGADKYAELLSNYRLIYSGRTSEAWRIRELAGAIAGEKVQPFLPEDYQWKPEERAINNYHQLIGRLYAELKGVETDENVSELFRQVANWENSLSPEIKDYVESHKSDWINDLPPEVQKVQRLREADLDYISQTGYWDIPTMEEQRKQGLKAVDFRSQVRQGDPQLDANLAFWFDYITSLKSQEAADLLVQKASDLGRPVSAIPALAQTETSGLSPTGGLSPSEIERLKNEFMEK